MNCDVIGFQEVFSKEALKELVNELGFSYFQTVDNAKVDNKNPNVYIYLLLKGCKNLKINFNKKEKNLF